MTLLEGLGQLDLKHFKPEEFINPGNHPLYTDPPRELWGNVFPTAIVLDELREALGAPIRITSAYRNPEHNKAVGGGKRSNHRIFTALDFKVQGSQKDAQAVLIDWRREQRLFRAKGFLLSTPFNSGVNPDPPIQELPMWRAAYGSIIEDRSIFEFRGGIGMYDTFTHLDTRGLNHTWKGGS